MNNEPRELSAEEYLNPVILKMYGEARVIHRTTDFAHVQFKNLHAAASWASSQEMARRCRLRDGHLTFDQPVVVFVDLRTAPIPDDIVLSIYGIS